MIGSVYDWLGFDVVDDRVFRDLVIPVSSSRPARPDSRPVLADRGATVVSYRAFQRHLAMIGGGGYRDRIAGSYLTHAADRGGLSLVLYDVTTLYCEAESEDDLRKVGYSRERRVDPQIVVGLLVDRIGFPLEIGCFEGNTAETTTIVPMVMPACLGGQPQETRRCRVVVHRGLAATRFGRFMPVAAASMRPASRGPNRWSGSRTTPPTSGRRMPAAEVIAKYHDLWHVERSFHHTATRLKPT